MPGRMMPAGGAYRGRYGAYTQAPASVPVFTRSKKPNRTAAFGNLPAEGSTFWRLSLGLVVRLDLTFLSVLCGTVHYIIMVLVSHVCSSSLEPSPRLESTVPTLVTQVA
jgi:hypothetical protein